MPASSSAPRLLRPLTNKTIRHCGLTQKSRVAVQALAACQRLIKASLGRVRVTCGKPSCRCAKGMRFRHTALAFTYKHNGRSMSLHVPRSLEPEARRAADDYARLKKLVQALSDENIKTFRREVQTIKAKSRQPVRACLPRR